MTWQRRLIQLAQVEARLRDGSLWVDDLPISEERHQGMVGQIGMLDRELNCPQHSPSHLRYVRVDDGILPECCCARVAFRAYCDLSEALENELAGLGLEVLFRPALALSDSLTAAEDVRARVRFRYKDLMEEVLSTCSCPIHGLETIAKRGDHP